MKLSFVRTRAELRPFIHSIWVFESAVGMPASDKNLAAPNGCPKLIIPYENSITSIADQRVQESREGGLYFVGNRDSATLLSTSPRRTGFIGIEFQPHGAYPIFGISMGETSNRLLAADEILSRWGRELKQALGDLPTVTEKVALIQDRLAARVQGPPNSLVTFCVTTLKSTDGLITIQELERRTGYSRRYLEILFNNHVGLSPKVLAGIFRFQRFYRKWAYHRPYDELRNELYDCYYDQAHFTREFKRMTRFSPLQFAVEVRNEFGRRLILE